MHAARIRIIVVDDEPMALHGLATLLGRDSEVEIVATCADGREAIQRIIALVPDVVFLDVQMPEIDGFQVLDEIGAGNAPVVVFVTAFDNFALRAFEVSALDYLLKPFADERAFEALDRAKRAARHRDREGLAERLAALLRTISPPGQQTTETRFAIREVSRVYWIPMRAVDWIEGADYYARLHVAGKAHLLRESLSSLAARLDPRQFCRVHRSAIVNLSRVREIRSVAGGDPCVVLHDGTRLKLARARRADLERVLELTDA